MKRFLTGLVAGLAVSYLTAPRSGEDTRRQLTDAANNQGDSLKEQWSKTVSQARTLIEDVKANMGIGQTEPNLFADMEAGKLDKYKDDARYLKEETNDTVDDAADVAKADVNRAEETLR